MRLFFGILTAALMAGPVAAKPLLSNSQDSYAKACIDFNDSYARIIEICERALTGDGFSPAQKLDMMDSLASAHLFLDQLDRSQKIFDDMLLIDPHHSDALNGLGWVQRDRGQYPQAVASFEQALQRQPSAEALGGMTASQYDAGLIDFDTALAQLDAALAIDPRHRWSMREKGWMLREAGRYREAEASFRQALQVRETDINALYGLARSLRGQDKYGDALEQINAALAIEPDTASYLSERSLILYYLDRNKQAINDADRVIALDPNWVTGYVRKARALADLGRRADAILLLETANTKLGLDGFLVYWLADLLADDGRYHDTIAQLQRLIDADLAGSGEMHLMAYAHLALEDFAGARIAADAAMALEPDGPYTLYYDARVLVEEDDFDQAETQIVAAVTAGLPEHQSQLFLSALASKREYVRMIRLRSAFRRIVEK